MDSYPQKLSSILLIFSNITKVYRHYILSLSVNPFLKKHNLDTAMGLTFFYPRILTKSEHNPVYIKNIFKIL